MITTYDAKDVNLIVNGVYGTGFAEGTFITYEKTEDNYALSVGAQGDVARAKVNNPLGTITVTFQQTSPQVKQYNDLAKSGKIVEARVIEKGSQTVKVGGTQCFIMKPANGEYGSEISNREFTIQVMDMEFS
jgi:LysM repeat protein